MLLYYFKIALRNIQRNKLHSIINIIGLSIGLACAVLILLYIMDELSWDKHNSKYKRIFVVQSLLKFGDQEFLIPNTSFPLGPALKNEYPDIEESIRTYRPGRIVFIDKKKQIIGEDAILYADPQIFNVFDHKFIYGSSKGVLDSPNAIVLNETLSKKYFGDQNPVGKILSVHNGNDYTVKGVFKDLPRNSSIGYHGLITMQNLPDSMGIEQYKKVSRSFASHLFTTCLLLRENEKISGVTENIKRFKNKYLHGALTNDNETIFQSLADYHMHLMVMPDLNLDRLGRVYILSTLAIFILIIASINYMTLSTARSMGRAREVGVRKVLGAGRASLIWQFLSESIIITIIAMVTALVFVELFLPTFNNLVYKELSFGLIGSVGLFSCVLLVTLIVGIMSGSYPAMVLSSCLPVNVFGKGLYSNSGKGLLRKILVVSQYSISIVMIVCMMLSIKQMSYVGNIDLGFDKENVFFINMNNDSQKKSVSVLKGILSGYSGISAVARSNNIAGSLGSSQCEFEDENGNPVNKWVGFTVVDHNYIDLMGMKIIEGSSFKREIGGYRENVVLINETFAKESGWTGSAIGKNIMMFNKSYKVAGVLNDFHGDNLHNRVGPAIILPGDESGVAGKWNYMGIIIIKVNNSNPKKTFEYINKKLLDLFPMDTPELRSLEDHINFQYRSENMLNSFLIYSAVFCILISCLGSFGLSSFIAENRRKEIGIRKVNGASVKNIVFNLTGNSLKLILISSIIACPIAYYVMSRWLESFAYRINIGPYPFILSVAIALIIAWLTVSFHAIKAAVADPVKALRYE